VLPQLFLVDLDLAFLYVFRDQSDQYSADRVKYQHRTSKNTHHMASDRVRLELIINQAADQRARYQRRLDGSLAQEGGLGVHEHPILLLGQCTPLRLHQSYPNTVLNLLKSGLS
jgi:hypothetical protein